MLPQLIGSIFFLVDQVEDCWHFPVDCKNNIFAVNKNLLKWTDCLYQWYICLTVLATESECKMHPQKKHESWYNWYWNVNNFVWAKKNWSQEGAQSHKRTCCWAHKVLLWSCCGLNSIPHIIHEASWYTPIIGRTRQPSPKNHWGCWALTHTDTHKISGYLFSSKLWIELENKATKLVLESPLGRAAPGQTPTECPLVLNWLPSHCCFFRGLKPPPLELLCVALEGLKGVGRFWTLRKIRVQLWSSNFRVVLRGSYLTSEFNTELKLV